MGGEQIDVLLLNGQDLRFFATSGMLEPLKGKYNVSDINKRLVPFTKQVYTIGGTQWAVSVGGISSSGLYYNKTIFKK
jgi:ABC-type glycerol-3-phosphate transport system substrate-binding protein